MASESCKYCVPDRYGYVDGFDKQSHAYISFNSNLGYHIVMRAKGWKENVPISYCPMCGRKLTVDNGKTD